jgi:hypothetical protein
MLGAKQAVDKQKIAGTDKCALLLALLPRVRIVPEGQAVPKLALFSATFSSLGA